MKRVTFLTVLLLGILTLSPIGLALNPQKKMTQYVIDNWGVEEGLPEISIRTIIQARDGYLWLGTEEGVVRFDGVRFEVYNKNKVGQIKNNWINVLLEDRKGVLWIGTYAGGVTCFHPREGKFTTITKEQGLVHDRVWSICEDHEGSLWIGTEGGLNCLKNGKIITYTTKEGLSKNLVEAILEDRKGNLWIGTDGGGLNCLRDGKFTAYTTKKGLADDRVMALYEDSSGNLWIGTDNGLNCREPGHESFKTYTTREGLSSNRVRSIYEDRDKNLWIGTYDGGLNRWEQGKFTKYTAQEGLSDVCIWCIYEDREGSLWIGTYTSGLYRLKDGKFTTYSRSEGLTDDIVKSVCEGPDGRIWIGTDVGGLNCLKDGKFTSYTTKEGLSDNQVKCLYTDREGNLWIGTAKGGLNRFKDGKFTIYTKKQGLAENLVRSICEDREGALWVGTGAGLNRIKDGKFTLYTTGQGLTSDIIRCIYEDREGNLWVGTDGGGLNHFKDGKFTAFTAKEGLVNDTVWCIHEDRQKNLWIGTSGGGVSCRKNRKFINITTKEGLFDDTIHQILEDDHENLWMSCNKGIFQVNRQEIDDFFQGKIHSLHCISYNEHDGMKSRECNGGIFPNGCKTRDGNLWFPTIKGAVTVDPNTIRKNMQLPPVRIEEIIVDNREIKSPLVTAGEPLVLPPGKNKLEIHFTDLSFQDVKKVLFKWKLEGFDNEWNEGGTRRTAYYSKVPPGQYKFRVTACNDEGIWNETGDCLSFYLTPKFTQTKFFKIFLILAPILLAFLIVFVFFRLRVWFLEKRAAKLRTLVKERTRDLEKAKKMAVKANMEKTQFLADRSHDIRNHMNLILGFSQVLESETTDEKQKRNLEAILSSGKTLLKLINDTLDLRKIESGKMKPEYEALNPRTILDEIKHIFSKKALEKSLDFQLEVDKALPEVIIMDGLLLHRILDNLVSNAVKNTDTGFIKLSAHTIGTPGDKVDLVFSVQDSGRGIPKDQQESIFQLFGQQKKNLPNHYEGAGLGLDITRRLVQSMGGEISLESREGKGSTFCVTFKDVEVSEISIGPEIPEPYVEGIRFEKATLLLVDDVEAGRWLFKEYLSQSPFEFIEAQNGREAVEMVKKHHPDLVLMDMRMPVMDGGEATRSIKADKETKNIPVIIITGSALEFELQEIKKAGGNSYLTKPVSKIDLIIELTRFLKWSSTELPGLDKAPGIEEDKGIMTSPADLSPQNREKLQELLTYLQSEDLTQRRDQLIKKFIIDDIETFSQEMKSLAEKYGIAKLIHWTVKLSNDIKTFNRSKIEKNLYSFPGLIKELKEKYKNGKP